MATNGEYVRLRYSDYLDRDDFSDYIRKGFDFGNIDAVFHLGACSATTEWMVNLMRNNRIEDVHWCHLEAHFSMLLLLRCMEW